MAGINIKENHTPPLDGHDKKFLAEHPNIDRDAFFALHHEVTEQFSTNSVGSPPNMEPRPVQQLPSGVTAEDMSALKGEQPDAPTH